MRVLGIRGVLCVLLLAAPALAQSAPENSKAAPAAVVASVGANAKAAQAAASKARQESDSDRSQRRAQAMRVLERSHSFNDQLALADQIQVLNRQIAVASRLERQLGRDWSAEALELIRQLSDPDDQAKAQANLVQNLASSDPDHALELFRQLPRPTSGGLYDGRILAAASLFPVLTGRRGGSGFEDVHQEAIRLGSEDAYPYSTMATLAMQSGRGRGPQPRDRSLANERTLQILQEGLDFYTRSRRSIAGDLTFAEMLQRSNSALTDDMLRPVLAVAVNNFLASAEEVDRKNSGNPGQSVNVVDLNLRRLADLVTKYDPDLASRIKQARPSAFSIGAVDSPGRNVTQSINNDFALSRIRQTARNDPNRALNMTNGLADDASRAQALSMVAGGLAAQDPEKATQLLQQADGLAANLDDLDAALRIVIVQADGASRVKNTALLRQCLAKGFSLGDKMIRADQDENPGHVTAWSSLYGLVRAGYGLEPELIVSYIDSLSVPVAKANLLLMAAQAEAAGAMMQQGRGNPAVRQE